MYAQKTRIVFQVRVRFAGAITRKYGLEIGLWLTRRATHPCLARVEVPSPRAYVHYFRVTSPSQLDAPLAARIREAYWVGRREHLQRRAT